MKKMLALVAVTLLSSTLWAVTTRTAENLQLAYNGESNAHARYLEFAKQADKDGYPSVASLFRAAARAEEVHATNHANVMKKMGVQPALKLDPVTPKTTRENLEVAVKGEVYERDTMYPDFLKIARSEANAGAIETFNEAKAAEAEHAKLYSAALAQLGSLKGKTAQYFVCTVCGYTTTKIDFEKCPVCFSPKEKYVAVS